MIARAPTRALAVVAPAAERPRVLVLRVAEPAPGETLKLAVDSSDQDGDGRDDVRLTVSVARQGSNESASADLGFFDRAAGVSRNTLEPSDSLARFASRETIRAKSKKNAPSVLERVDNARRLLASLCAESGTPRLFDEDNNPVRCGNLEKSVDFLALAEQTAALTLGDPARAASVLARDGWYVRGVSANQKKQLERELSKALTLRELKSAVSLGARPKLGGRAHWSPLWFEPNGELLVQTAAGVMRVAADGSSETPLDPDAGSDRVLRPFGDRAQRHGRIGAEAGVADRRAGASPRSLRRSWPGAATLLRAASFRGFGPTSSDWRRLDQAAHGLGRLSRGQRALAGRPRARDSASAGPFGAG
jgi:hypothetical protein